MGTVPVVPIVPMKWGRGQAGLRKHGGDAGRDFQRLPWLLLQVPGGVMQDVPQGCKQGHFSQILP